MIYLLVFILLLIPVVKYDWMAKTGGENKWYFFNLVILILLAGLRYRVGGDTLMYMSMYNEWPAMDELKYFDFEEALYNPLWYIYTSVAKSINEEFWVLQMIQAVIVNCTFFHFFRKYSPQYYFSAILLYYVGYYCYFNMEIMREILCICILMLATDWLIEKKWIKYILASILAIQIHYSAATMLLFPLFFIFLKKPSWTLQLVFMLAVLVVLNVVNVASLIVSVLPVDENFGELVEKYIDLQTSFAGLMVQLLKYLPVLGFIFIRSRCPDIYSDKFAPIVMGVVFAYAMSMGFAGFERLVNYFTPFVIVFIVHTIYNFISSMNLKNVQVSMMAMFASIVILSFNYGYYYLRDMSEFYPNTRFNIIFSPYYSIFNPEIDEQREKFIENYREVSFVF